MPYRKLIFVNGEYYHVLNRGVGQIPIFLNRVDFKHFLRAAFYYQLEGPKPRFSNFYPEKTQLDVSRKLVEIISYCLMPNHFHFLLRQERDGGVIEFIRKLTNSYAKYFNLKNKRIGPLFQGEFKAVRVEGEEQLFHLSRYIHLNPVVNYLAENPDKYDWSSYREYIGLEKHQRCLKEPILLGFRSSSDYAEFVKDQMDYGKKLEFLKHQLLE